MRSTVFSGLLVIGAIVGALVPFSASAQTTQPTSQSAILAELPGSLSKTLSSNLSQIQSAQATGDPQQVANATQIFEQTIGVALGNADANLENDESMTQGTTTANLSGQTSSDQALVSELVALDATVPSMSANQ